MPARPFDYALYRRLYGEADIARLFREWTAFPQMIAAIRAARKAVPNLDLDAIIDVTKALGDAPDQARAIAKAVRNDV